MIDCFLVVVTMPKETMAPHIQPNTPPKNIMIRYKIGYENGWE